jgi:NAD(P)-dependent dehydrogenase (short-subunit alcohol dehydrogenase family)
MSIALVTGASKGIGKSICMALLQQGWQVYGISRSNPQLSQPGFVWLNFDLMHFEDYPTLADRLPAVLDLVILSAGIAYGVDLAQLSQLDIDKQFAMNTKSPILLAQQLSSKLQQGKVINLSSQLITGADANLALYAASKAATAVFFKSINANLAITNLLLGPTDSPLAHSLHQTDTNLLSIAEVTEVLTKLAADKDRTSQTYRLDKHASRAVLTETNL